MNEMEYVWKKYFALCILFEDCCRLLFLLVVSNLAYNFVAGGDSMVR